MYYFFQPLVTTLQRGNGERSIMEVTTLERRNEEKRSIMEVTIIQLYRTPRELFFTDTNLPTGNFYFS